MTKTFIVKVTAKKGACISGTKIYNAVWNTAEHPGEGEIKNVDVLEAIHTEVNTEYMKPLYALGRKDGRRWMLIDFFNSEKRVENAIKKSVRNYKGCAMKGEFALLSFCPSLLVWQIEGESVKVG